MELHLALRNIVKTDGPSIITEGRLVNILCDFQAFDAIPASKYVMRAIIDDGYSKKLLQCAKWDMAAQQLSGQFAMTTGFQQDIVWTIFQSLAYGLGWINKIDKLQSPQQSAPQPLTPLKNRQSQIRLTSSSTDRDKSLYLNSIVERKENMEKTLGVSFDNISFDVRSGGKTVECFIEVTGTKLKTAIEIRVVFYDNFGSIARQDHKFVDEDSFNGFDNFNIVLYSFNTDIADLSRVIVYPAKY